MLYTGLFNDPEREEKKTYRFVKIFLFITPSLLGISKFDLQLLELHLFGRIPACNRTAGTASKAGCYLDDLGRRVGVIEVVLYLLKPL